MSSSYRSPPPSYTSNDINPPPTYSSRAQQSSRHSSSYLSSTVSSTSDYTSETSTSRTVSSTSYPSSGTSHSSSPSPSRSHLHNHSHFHHHNHSHYNTTGGRSRPANNPINAGTSEATPLLKPTTSHSFAISEKSELRYLRIAMLIFVALTLCHLSGLFSKKSDLTSFWVDIIPAPTCHAVGVREYTATLASIPGDWDPIQACQKTPFVVHGKPANVTPSCSLLYVPVNDTTTSAGITVVQGRWLVDFDESDCQPIWSPIETDLCVGPGRRSYHAELDYVPPGLDQLTSCRDAPAVIHDRSVFSNRCDMVLKHGEGTGDDTLVARGYWEIDFSEPYCEPVWTSVTDLRCQAYDTGRYTAILEEIPWELDPLETCYQFPLWLSGSYRTPQTCEQENGRVVGSWFVQGIPECSPCRPVLRDIRDWGCMESGFKRVEGEPVDFGPHEDWYPICITIPLRWEGQTYLPEQCETRKSWFHTRRYTMYKIPAWYCH